MPNKHRFYARGKDPQIDSLGRSDSQFLRRRSRLGSSVCQLARKQSTEPASPLRFPPGTAAAKAGGLLAASRRWLTDDPSHSLQQITRATARAARALIKKPLLLRVGSQHLRRVSARSKVVEGGFGVSPESSVSKQRGDPRLSERDSRRESQRRVGLRRLLPS
jgi:hypothetical protein